MAAAYAALVSLFNNLELIQTHPFHSFSFDDKQIQSLLQIVCYLIDFMEARDYHGGDKEAAETLERQIASAAHAAEDDIESHVVDQIRGGFTRSVLRKKMRSPFLPDLQKVIEDMELVRRKAIKVQDAQSGFKAEQPTFSAATSSTPLTTDKDKLVGFDDVLLQLLDLLTGYRPGLQVIPIVGTGGIGKTTLAKNAFQHKLIVEHFDVRLWVTISQQYIVSDILSKLLSGGGESNCETVDKLGVEFSKLLSGGGESNCETVNKVGEELRKRLYGRRYLIVLDDMWSVEAWDEIKRFFPDTNCGSRIIVTTRQSNVADHFGSRSLAMSFLKEEESWDLFCEKAFAEQSCPLELQKAGKKIVKKCRGLPLAIVVVGGHLRTSPKSQDYWENVANHMKSILNSGENDDELFDILYLSYSYLPVHLKPCFLYMGVFPEDYKIDVSELTRLWIGEGFVKANKDQTLEEVAEGCLNDLIGRNLILVHHSSKMRKVKTCVIHDVLRELCLKIGEKEKFFCVYDTSQSIDRERRVVINREEMQHVLRSAPLLRSQITWRSRCDVPFHSKLLRVVRTRGEVEDILTRVNLRLLYGYVELFRYFELNSSISLLWNLQTLIVQGGDGITIEIWELTQLRHLECDYVDLPDPLPSDEANDMVLRNLQTLRHAINLRLSDEVCKRIPNIKELEMTYDDFVKECEYYCPHNLGRLHKLESLHCSIYPKGPEWHEFAQALTFPSSLKELELWNAGLDWEEITMKIGSLPLLEVLYLGNIEGGAEWNPVEGGFPRLRSLAIEKNYYLRNWNAERWHFPVLEHLHLEAVWGLGELPSDIGEIATLERIELKQCSVDLYISGVRLVMEQQDIGNDNLQLHVEFMSITKEERERFEKRVEEEGLTTNNVHLT